MNEIKIYPLLPNANNIDKSIYQTTKILSQVEKSIPDAIYTYELVLDFLKEKIQNPNNYRSFKGDINLFLNWCWLVKSISVSEVDRRIMREFVDFCNTPPNHLISKAPLRQHIEKDTIVFNPDWAPFVNPSPEKPYIRKETSLKNNLSNISSFYHYLIEVFYCEHNPASTLLKSLNSSNTRVEGVDFNKEKALSDNQVVACLLFIESKIIDDPETYERLRFLFKMMVILYPRISEIGARPAYSPSMSNFRRSRNSNCWFYYIPKSKGNKSREVSCSEELIKDLVRYRNFLGLSDMPTLNDDHPLFIRKKASSHGRDKGYAYSTLGIDHLSSLIKDLFIDVANSDIVMTEHERNELVTFSAHSCRHYGITNDIVNNKRDLYEVAKESGHSDIRTLSGYISSRNDVRLKNAFNKSLPSQYQEFFVE